MTGAQKSASVKPCKIVERRIYCLMAFTALIFHSNSFTFYFRLYAQIKDKTLHKTGWQYVIMVGWFIESLKGLTYILCADFHLAETFVSLATYQAKLHVYLTHLYWNAKDLKVNIELLKLNCRTSEKIKFYVKRNT